MKPGLVSIIMPAYNGETFLEQAIYSVLAQTYNNWELLVVDDGSIDHTAKIIAAFQDPRLRYTYQENRGQAAALNRGLELAEGEYVTTLDTDDWYTQESLAERVRFLEQNPQHGAVYGDGQYCTTAGEPFNRFSSICLHGVVGDIYDDLINLNFGTGAVVLIRRSVLEQHQLRYDETIVWCQDWDFYLRLAEKSTFGCIEAITVCYRMHDTNMTLAMPSTRRLESTICTRLKVLASPRFAAVPIWQKSVFLYNLLDKLKGQVTEQAAIIKGMQFQSLPKPEQARLMRLLALDYLQRGEHNDVAKKWLRTAWSLAPLDLKTALVAILSRLNLKLTRWVTKAWRSSQQQGQYISPFEMAKMKS